MWNVPRASRQFAWPVWSGTVTSGFGIRHGTMHDGVDIAAPLGTAVRAADSGTVVFVGKLNGYGNTVIIRHSDNYVTVYGHNSRMLVSEGTSVARGQTIAEVGDQRTDHRPQSPFRGALRQPRLQSAELSGAAGSYSPCESFARNGPS